MSGLHVMQLMANHARVKGELSKLRCERDRLLRQAEKKRKPKRAKGDALTKKLEAVKKRAKYERECNTFQRRDGWCVSRRSGMKLCKG